jgi:hypothetical protein
LSLPCVKASGDRMSPLVIDWASSHLSRFGTDQEVVTPGARAVRDAPPLAMFGVLVVVSAAVGLFFWSRPDVKAAFERA